MITPPQIAFYQSSTESDRVHFLIQLAKTGQQEIAAELLKLFPLQGPLAINRTLFIEGLIDEGRHDLTGAAKKFRAALANDPKLTLVRSELAQVLFRLDEGESAKHHLQLLEADAPTATDAASIRNFIDKIDQSRPYSFSGYVSLAPTTNINSGSSHSTVYSSVFGADLGISAANQKQSGLGGAAGLSLGYSKRLGNDWQAVLAGNIDTQIYPDWNFDSFSTSESGEMRYMLSGGFVSLGGVASQSASPAALQLTYNSYGPRAALRYNLDQRNLFTASAIYEWRDYTGSSVQNGTALLTDAGLTHAFDSTLNTTVFGGYDNIASQLKSISYETFFGGLNVYKELPLGITLDVSAQARLSYFDGINLIAGYARQDQRYIATATITKRDINLMGFAPSIAFTETLNHSNIAIFDYDAQSVDLRLTKDF